jgi:hypothetical protein
VEWLRCRPCVQASVSQKKIKGKLGANSGFVTGSWVIWIKEISPFQA